MWGMIFFFNLNLCLVCISEGKMSQLDMYYKKETRRLARQGEKQG